MVVRNFLAWYDKEPLPGGGSYTVSMDPTCSYFEKINVSPDGVIPKNIQGKGASMFGKGLKINGKPCAKTVEKEPDDIPLGLKKVWDLGRLSHLFRANLRPVRWRTLPMAEMRKRRAWGYRW